MKQGKFNQKALEDSLESMALFAGLCPENKSFIIEKSKELRFTNQNLTRLLEYVSDFEMWEAPLLENYWDASYFQRFQGKQRQKSFLDLIHKEWDRLKNESPNYLNKTLASLPQKKIEFSLDKSSNTVLGACPVFSDSTRCCNLQTLDAVMGCAYGCTYCSIQSFYNDDAMVFHEDFAQKLNAIELDPQKTYHIGTGQSSDSLLWGNKNDVLSDLFAWAKKNPNVILELKTKSANISYLLENEVPKNVLVTWSVNAESVIRHEELKTASLDERLAAAEKVRNKGILVGFHLHPIVLFKAWETEYLELAKSLTRRFSPDQVALLSLGTLTFIKPVLKELRTNKAKSRILQMPFEDAAGKLSYPLEKKKVFFKQIYDMFSEWHGQVFSYLCMEDHALWKEVLGHDYSDNLEFEEAMKAAYLKKIHLLK